MKTFKEFNQYSKYLDDEEFMKYFNEIKKRVTNLFPDYQLNLELIIDQIYFYYESKWLIEDTINRLNADGKFFQYYSGIGDI